MFCGDILQLWAKGRWALSNCFGASALNDAAEEMEVCT